MNIPILYLNQYFINFGSRSPCALGIIPCLSCHYFFYSLISDFTFPEMLKNVCLATISTASIHLFVLLEVLRFIFVIELDRTRSDLAFPPFHSSCYVDFK